MAIDLSTFTDPGILLLIGASAFLIIFIVILLFIQGRLKKRLVQKTIKVEQQQKFKKKLDVLKTQAESPEQTLNKISAFAKDFFKAKFNISEHKDYSETLEIFKKNHKKNLAFFCEQMLLTLYSGEEITRTQVENLNNLMERILIEEGASPKKAQDQTGPKVPGQFKLPKLPPLPKLAPKTPKKTIINLKMPKFIKPHMLTPKPQKETLEVYTVKGSHAQNNQQTQSNQNQSYFPQNTQEQQNQKILPDIHHIVKQHEENQSQKTQQKTGILGKLTNQTQETQQNQQPQPEPKNHRYVQSIDNLDRIKEKILRKKKIKELSYTSY